MGGRGTTGNTKLFTNIDAARNAPLRAARAKEIEAERAKTSSTKSAAKSSKKVIQEPGTVTGNFYGKESKDKFGFTRVGTDNRSIASYARTADGRLHASSEGRGIHTITEARTGLRVHAFDNKKDAIGFLNSVTRKDGRISPTFERALRFGSGEDRSAKNALAAKALAVMIKRHDSGAKRLESAPSNIKRKSR
jgi:hypothetical protein